jgi:arginyl-tRNA synthetase
MNIFADFQSRITMLLEKRIAGGELPRSLDLGRFVVEPPRESAHGDLSTNAAMVYAREAKEAGSNPRALAASLALDLTREPDVLSAEAAGPGFINIVLKPEVYHRVLSAILTQGVRFGAGAPSADGPVNVEYVSANPTGPMHVGHARGAVFGDALASLLIFSGREATREYYVNDAGGQVDVLARSAYLRYREALGEDIGSIPEGLYPGDYLKPVGQDLAREFGSALKDEPEAEWLPKARQRAIDAMMAMIRADLAALNITHEVFASERALTGADGGEDRVREAIDWLRARGLIYQGRLPPPKGGAADDWEDREQTLFRSIDFGDDVDRPLIKSDGAYTYFAGDIAYHKTKIDRGYQTLVDVWGADHGGYVKRMQAAVAALSERQAVLDVKLIQLVKLLRQGEPVKMSKRAGEFVTLREVVDEVGRDAVRFMMLFRKNDAPLDFDLAKVIEQSRDNPVFYVQYAHARCWSALRNAGEAFPDLPTDFNELLEAADVGAISDPAELALVRQIALYPRVVEAAAAAHEPHRIAFYLYDLASEFHALWTLGNTRPHLRFIMQNDRQMTLVRLVLVQGVRTVLASGLGLLGVGAPNEMR